MFDLNGAAVVERIESGIMAYKVVIPKGAYVRAKPSYDPSVEKVDTVDEGDIVNTDSHLKFEDVLAPNGKKFVWVQLHTKHDGWVPMHHLDGKPVLQEYDLGKERL